MSGCGRGRKNFVLVLAFEFWALTTNIAGNELDNFGHRAVGASAVVAAVLAAGYWLRALPPPTRLHRCVNGSLLVCGLAAAVVAEFGSRHLSPYATLVAVGLTVTALLIIPGVPIANTLFRVALIGLGVALLGGAVAAWRLGGNGLALALVTFLELGLLALIHIGARYGAATIVAAAEAGMYRDFGELFLGLGAVFSLPTIVYLCQGSLVGFGISGLAALASFGLGVAFRKGGRYRVGTAVLGCGVAAAAIGVAIADMADGLWAGVTIIGMGLALIGFGAQRLDVVRWLRAWGRYLTVQLPPEGR